MNLRVGQAEAGGGEEIAKLLRCNREEREEELSSFGFLVLSVQRSGKGLLAPIMHCVGGDGHG